jgi:hypothetical protein
MRGRSYFYVSGSIFGAVAILHFIRAVGKVPVHVGTLDLPLWLSWGGGVFALALCTWAFRLARGGSIGAGVPGSGKEAT